MPIVKEKLTFNEVLSYAQKIKNDDDVMGRVDAINDVDWYKVEFPDDGKANFYLNPLDPELDVELYIYDYTVKKIAASTQ